MLRATVCYNIATVDKADEAEAAPNEPLVHTIHMYKYAQMCLYHIVCSSVAKYSYLYNMAIHTLVRKPLVQKVSQTDDTG